MIKHYKKLKGKAGRHKTLIQNFSYLSALQVFNMLLPLITYPYLIRVLGKETYGLVVFAQAIIGYLVILVGFGFNISATKEVSVNRNNKEKLNEIVSSVLIIKGILFVLAVIILSVLLYLIPQAKGYETLFILTLWMCLYDMIFPIWYFQGIEKMKYITYITLLSRMIFLGLIFIFIHTSNDYLYIPIINGIGAILAGLTSLYIVFAKDKLKFSLQSYTQLKYYFKDSIPIFVSNVSIKLYMSTNKVIVGSFLGMSEVAYYDLAEKLSGVLKTPILLTGQAIYPIIAKEKNKEFIRKSFKLTIIASIIILIIGWSSSDFIIQILGGKDMNPSVPILRILLISIIPVTIGLFFADLVLISWGFNKDYLKVRTASIGVYAICVVILIIFQLINLYTLSILTVFTEIIVSFISFVFINKRGVNFLQKKC